LDKSDVINHTGFERRVWSGRVHLDVCEVDFDGEMPWFDATALVNHNVAGFAKLYIQTMTAELQDLYVYGGVTRGGPLQRLSGRRSYRRRGIGTALLTAVCERLCVFGISRIEGDVVEEGLERWYEERGFSYDATTKRIWKTLAASSVIERT
jgi:GNAT superfamily N-acetyltransferase